MNRKQHILATPLICLSLCLDTISCATPDDYERDIKNCISELNYLLQTQQGWVKVHAAEYLLWTGYGDRVKEIFLDEEKKYGDSIPYRVGIWRVLAQATSVSDEKNIWIKKIANAFLDEKGHDRVHAVESLAKLQVSPMSFSKVKTENALADGDEALSSYTKWSMAYHSAESYKQTQQALLEGILDRSAYNSSDTQVRIRAFALKQLSPLDQRNSDAIVQSALLENDSSTLKLDLMTLAHTVSTLDTRSPLSRKLYELLIRHYDKGNTKERMQLLLALTGNNRHTKQLLAFYNREKQLDGSYYDPDVHATAAYALLKSINTNK